MKLRNNKTEHISLKFLFLLLLAGTLLCMSSLIANAEDPVGEYIVGVSDRLGINVVSEPGLGTTVIVASDGTVTFPYIGLISVKGLTIVEIENEISKKLSEGYFKYPVVSISLLQSTSKMIHVYGQVIKNGRYSFGKGFTVIQAISMAGGIKNDGLYGKVKVRRKQDDKSGFKDIVIDMNGTRKGYADSNTLLKADDILIVERNETFLIQGMVAQRGRFALEDEITVLKALLQAGGVTGDGLFGLVKVRRRKNEGEVGGYRDIVESKLHDGVIESREVEDMLLQPDDILIVDRNKTYFLYGQVGRTGKFVLEDDITVMKAISMAGGIRNDGLYGRVKVRRKQDDEPGYSDILIDMKETVESDAIGNMLLQPDDILIVERNKNYFVYGEIPRPGEFILKDDMTVFEAIILAGGFTKWGSPGRVKILRPMEGQAEYTTIKVSINDIVRGDASSDVLLQPGDIIVASSGIL